MQTLEQFTNVLPPEAGAIIAIAVDDTSRVYDLSSLSLPHAWRFGGEMFMTLHADGGAVYFAFGDSNAVVEETAAVAAGSAVAFTATAAAKLPADVPLRLRLSRGTGPSHIAIKTASGTATLRMYVSSHPTR